MDAHASQPLLDDVEAFCRAVRPVEDECYRAERFNDRVVPLAREHDLLGLLVPGQYGGRELDAVTYARALRRVGREGTTVRTFFSAHCSIGTTPIVAFGSDDQKRRYLPAAARGELLLAFGLTEPEAGSNPLEMTTTFERRGDSCLLTGTKYLISNGVYSDAVVTFAYPKDGPRRLSAFILDTAGATCVRRALGMKMGMPTSNSSMFELHAHPVRADNLLGPEGDGFRVAMTALVSGRLSVAAGCVGVIEDRSAHV